MLYIFFILKNLNANILHTKKHKMFENIITILDINHVRKSINTFFLSSLLGDISAHKN